MALFSQTKDETEIVDDDATAVVTDERPRTVGRAQVDEREAARRRLAAPVTGTVVDTTARTPVATYDAVGPRPRASMMASLALIFGVAAALVLLTGVLPGPAVALGVVAAFMSIGGLSATSRRHVAGKSDALFGLALGLATIVVGVLGLTGTLPMFGGETNYVTEARDWLQSQLPWLFPG